MDLPSGQATSLAKLQQLCSQPPPAAAEQSSPSWEVASDSGAHSHAGRPADKLTAGRQPMLSFAKAVSSMDEYLCSLKKHVTELQRWEEDSKSLMMCSAASQLISKIARAADREMDPYYAWHTTVDIVADSERGKQLVDELQQKYPMLMAGIDLLCEDGYPAYPYMEDTSVQELKDLIEEQMMGNTDQATAAMSVVDCLAEMAERLQEPLFIKADKPKNKNK